MFRAMISIEQQTLLIDADDTLWENNIHYERVIEAVQAMLQPLGVTPQEFRTHLDFLEGRNIALYGYGTLNFTRSLVQAFEKFLPPDADESLVRQVERMGLEIMSRPLEIIDGVPETLEYLSGRHSLFLVTKGDQKEQSRKVETSRLGSYFRAVEIVSEKDPATYRGLLERHAWDPARTWMIGNSPRSDINPAIGAGLNAVFIPHPNTWVLEHEETVADPRVLKVERFSDLRNHF